MAFIHDRQECLTGVQEHAPWSPRTDLRVDFVMVYGVDAAMPSRVRAWQEKGYVVHTMTGCAWGDYADYWDGTWDGVPHWDESQCGRDGQPILHGANSPYLCPTASFARYLTEKIIPAVDAGVDAVYLEEPEYWDAAGYGAAFRREWQAYYGEPWRPPHESLESHYRASALKVYLFRRLIRQVTAGLKAHAASLGRQLAVYVPTHSLVNYTQWKILSPEGTLADMPEIDGCIAQVWTGTARAGHVYRGRYASRVFETAFLEYGAARELVRGSGRRMWFLHDPVEDNPEYTWESFRDNWLKTVAASLMHPDVCRYEVVPWPDRVFNGVYPKKGSPAGGGLGPGQAMEGAKPIPPSYAELICTLIQTLGDMDQPSSGFDPAPPRIGVLIADSALYQRTFPDPLPHSPEGVEGLHRRLFALLDGRAGEDDGEDGVALMRRIAEDPGLYLDYAASGAFPHFFGLAMPLVKAGIPLRPVQMENLVRLPCAADGFDTLILSEEWLKPRDPREHEALAAWVRQGGTLILTGDGSDPYHALPAWWNTGQRGYAHPARHLCDLLGLGEAPAQGVYPVGEGRVAVYPVSPARLTLTKEAADAWLRFVLACAAPDYRVRNHFLMKRGPYRVAAVMEECESDAPLVLKGRFADLLSESFPITTEARVAPGAVAILFDLDAPGEALRPIASTARIGCLEETEAGYRVRCQAPEGVRIRMRLRLPRAAGRATARTEAGTPLRPDFIRWDEPTHTVLFQFPSCPGQVEIRIF